MNWTLANLKDMADVFQSVATPTALVIAGIWAYKKYVVEGSKYPHIQSSAAMDFIGQQGGYWIVELRAVLENKGKVEHRIADFGFDLNAIFSSEQVAVSDEWGGQVDFPHCVAELCPKVGDGVFRRLG